MRMSRAISRAMQAIERFAGEPVTYRRGEYSISLTATRGDKSSVQEPTGNESAVRGIRLDWILNIPQTYLEQGRLVPAEGDEIIDDKGVRYRVTKSPADGKCAREQRHGQGMRIHTLVVEGEL
jgi:hypothetical protein